MIGMNKFAVVLFCVRYIDKDVCVLMSEIKLTLQMIQFIQSCLSNSMVK